MDLPWIISQLEAGIKPKFYKMISDDTTKTCSRCLKHADEVFMEDDPNMPQLPLHPNCDCFYMEVDISEFLRQKNFVFGAMSPNKWEEQCEADKNLWCNAFRIQFGDSIDKYASRYNVPKQLLAGIIANEMIDWKWPDGSFLDGLGGGGVGYAQIAPKTAQRNEVSGSQTSIAKQLKTIPGSVEIAAKLLRHYLDELQSRIDGDNLGDGFKKSTLYYMAKPSILKQGNLVDINTPEWLLNTMCAVWNSGLGVLDAQDPIGDENYSNAYIHGTNSSMLKPYLPKLVKE